MFRGLVKGGDNKFPKVSARKLGGYWKFEL